MKAVQADITTLTVNAIVNAAIAPYYGPWAWMNRQARAMVDELVDAVYAKHGLSDRTPLICTGGSMGGQASLLYTRCASGSYGSNTLRCDPWGTADRYR